MNKILLFALVLCIQGIFGAQNFDSMTTRSAYDNELMEKFEDDSMKETTEINLQPAQNIIAAIYRRM